MGERNKRYVVSADEEKIVVRYEVGLNVDMTYLTDVADAVLDAVDLDSGTIDFKNLPVNAQNAVGQGLFNPPYNYKGVADTLIGDGGLTGSPIDVAGDVLGHMQNMYRGLQEDLAEQERKLYEDSEFGARHATLKEGTRLLYGRDGTSVFVVPEDFVAVEAEGGLIDALDHLLLNVIDVIYLPKRMYVRDPDLPTGGDADTHYGSSEWTKEYEDWRMVRYARDNWTDILLFSANQNVHCFSRIGKRLLDPQPPEGEDIRPASCWYEVPHHEDSTSQGDAAIHSLTEAFKNYAYWTGKPEENPYTIPQYPYEKPWPPRGYSEYLDYFWPDVEDFWVSRLGGTWVSGKIQIKETYIRFKQRYDEEGGSTPGTEPPVGGGGILPAGAALSLLSQFGLRLDMRRRQKHG